MSSSAGGTRLIKLSELATQCTIVRAGGSFHNLKHRDNRLRSVVFALAESQILDVTGVADKKLKVRLTVSVPELRQIVDFETAIKRSIMDTKVGNMFMSPDLIENIGSATSLPNTLTCTAFADQCKVFTKDAETGRVTQLPAKDWSAVLCRGASLEYAIVEPFKFWFIDEAGSFTYRLRNLTVMQSKHVQLRKLYSFDDDDDE